tara:strand:- start:66 stop:545 length:480 start_codon:yes stop_codon:yes gene_type:complete
VKNVNLIVDAINIATKAHKGQYRKSKDINGDMIEFITHPIEVSKIANDLSEKYDVDLETISIAAILHDTIEDTHITYNDIKGKFGKEIADIVKTVTNETKKPYMEFIKDIIDNGSREALVVKVADITHNMSTGKGVISNHKYSKWSKSLIMLKDLLKRD